MTACLLSRNTSNWRGHQRQGRGEDKCGREVAVLLFHTSLLSTSADKQKNRSRCCFFQSTFQDSPVSSIKYTLINLYVCCFSLWTKNIYRYCLLSVLIKVVSKQATSKCLKPEFCIILKTQKRVKIIIAAIVVCHTMKWRI